MTIAAPRTAPDQREEPDDTAWLPCVLYLRLSDARNEKGSFDQRRKKLCERALANRWRVVRTVIENDEVRGDGTRSASASAFKRVRVKNPDGTWKMQDGRHVMRVWRPGFQSVLGDLAAGRARALLTEALDRTMRDPRDLEDLIDVVKHTGSFADSLSGSLKFTAGGTDSEYAVARVMVAMGSMSSADTVRRVTEGRERKAARGEFGGGRRPYGFGVQRLDSNGVPKVKDNGRPDLDYNAIVPAEAAEIRAWADQVLAGVPLKAVARDLINRGLPTATGGAWISQTVRIILLRPRIAGIMVHRRAEIGPAPWEAILPEDVWRAVVARLKDPAATITWTQGGEQRTAVRGTGVGRAPTHLGTGLFLCHCGQPVSIMGGQQRGTRRYRCDASGSGHVARSVANVDALVTDVIVEKLAEKEAEPARTVPAEDSDTVDANALRAEKAVLEERKGGMMDDEADGLITRQERNRGVKRINKRVAEIDAVLTANTAVDPAAKLHEAAAGIDDLEERIAAVRAVWEALPLGLKRKIIADRLRVTILPTRRGRWFDPASVRIEAAE